MSALLTPRTYADLLALVDASPPIVASPEQIKAADVARQSAARRDSLPRVLLPGGITTITDCAAELGKLMAATGCFYERGGVAVRSIRDELEPVKVSAARSEFETVASLRRSAGDGEDAPAICKKDEAEAILAAKSFTASLPPIVVRSQCPLLVESGGNLKVVAGYDRESGVLAMGCEPEQMTMQEAKHLISLLLRDFDFPTAGDYSRAAAGFISPALVLGGLLGEYRAPADYSEADKSQSGKGYRAKLTTAIYRHRAYTITQRERGVGSPLCLKIIEPFRTGPPIRT